MQDSWKKRGTHPKGTSSLRSLKETEIILSHPYSKVDDMSAVVIVPSLSGSERGMTDAWEEEAMWDGTDYSISNPPPCCRSHPDHIVR